MSDRDVIQEQETRELFRCKKIAVLMGGMSSERDVSIKTGNAVLTALQQRGYNAVPAEADSDVARLLVQLGIDIAFVAVHGVPGEDGTIQGLLEILGIPYTGSDVLASAVSMNKIASKKIFSYHQLPTPAFQCFCEGRDDVRHILTQITLPLPFVVKPAAEGSTIGVAVVRNPAEIGPALTAAFNYSDEILVEAFVSGRELTVGILNDRALPIVEIRPKSGFYDFRSKYMQGETEYRVNPVLEDGQARAVQETALGAYRVLGCSTVARVDIMLGDAGTPFILEVNTVPGMTQTSLLPMAARQAGIAFESLVEHILWGASLKTRRRLTRTGTHDRSV